MQYDSACKQELNIYQRGTNVANPGEEGGSTGNHVAHLGPTWTQCRCHYGCVGEWAHSPAVHTTTPPENRMFATLVHVETSQACAECFPQRCGRHAAKVRDHSDAVRGTTVERIVWTLVNVQWFQQCLSLDVQNFSEPSNTALMDSHLAARRITSPREVVSV